jgi:hypothetical protein
VPGIPEWVTELPEARGDRMIPKWLSFRDLKWWSVIRGSLD